MASRFDNGIEGILATASAFAFIGWVTLAPMETAESAFETSPKNLEMGNMMTSNYVGLWVTGDGHIRHELLPNGRYVEARGNRERAYEGRYRLNGDHIEYVDDSGFIADGDFRGGILYHAGMVLYRD